ncbi:MipA/OmpV family protein [Altericroceibacterium xinjiangense]|uniref:MipA/OmpV family protein n=1 Tax=Altericroceibacterium xinjiangense TaxID=762261 RepID=UPI0013E01D24|nr:MipA/OmpV family protein [Altericroceibacterium xinjiangense]
MKINGIAALSAGLLGCGLSVPAFAQDAGQSSGEYQRTRIDLGVQFQPSYPGSDKLSPRPLFGVARATGDEPFAFEAPDESFGFALWRQRRLSFGFAVGLEGSRTAKDVGAALPKVGFTVEPGVFLQYETTPSTRLRGEIRRGIGGHDGWIGTVGGDYVARTNDDWLFSVGPRLTLADGNYQDAYFTVAPEDAAGAGLPTYDADGGLQAVGATASFLKQLSAHWGVYTYAKYDRLIGDPANSPLVREFGSRDQFSGGVALSYTFGG